MGLAIKKHHSKFLFPSAAPPPLFIKAGSSPPLPLPCWTLFQNPQSYLYVCGPSSIWPLRIFQHNLTDFEPQFSLFQFFHVTGSLGALSNSLALVLTPFQHQYGVLMVCGRHQLTGLCYSVHILFILHKSFSQASSSIYLSLF